MDRRNVRNPELQLPGSSVCSRRVRGLDDLPLRVSFHEETRQVGHVVYVTKGYVVGTAMGSKVTL